MNSKKAGILFGVLACTLFSAILIYPKFSEKTEKAIPVFNTFYDSNSPKTENTEAYISDNSEIREKAAENDVTSVPFSKSEAIFEISDAIRFPIDLNTATAEEFMQIKGIGRAVAESIVAYRENYGYFYSVEDLLKVNNLGSKRFNALKDYVYVAQELIPETTILSDTYLSEKTIPETTVTVPSTYSSSSSKIKTTVETTVTAAAVTEESDDWIIIEEITDYKDEDNDLIKDNTSSVNSSYWKTETTSDEYYPNFPIELNTASVKDLTYIKGVGEALAQKIVDYARSYGFYDVNDLLNVSGISQNRLNNIRPYVYVDSSGLPPKPETSVSSLYDDIYDNSLYTSDIFPDGTTAAITPGIYKVNVNTASKSDFMQLPGIDEVLADNIISLRSKIGGFATIEELSLADGMTNSKLSAIWNYIYV